MLELLRYYEQAAGQFEVGLLVLPGVFAVLAGLVIWLAGLRVRKVVSALIITIIAVSCTPLLFKYSLVPAICLAVVAIFAGLFFEKVILSVIAGAIGVVICLTAFAVPQINKSDYSAAYPKIDPTIQASITSSAEAISVLKQHLCYAGDVITNAHLDFNSYYWIAAIATGIIIMVAGFIFPRLIIGLCCACVGAALVFTGMILLLLYKNAEPMSCIWQKGSYFTAVFAAMTAFGASVQLLFCRQKSAKTNKKEKKDTTGDSTTKRRFLEF